MNYKSPVDLIVSEMNLRMEGEIFKAVQNVGVNVDKDELIKALQYDRNQYQKGYTDRDSEIIRCNNCKYFELFDGVFPVCRKWGNGCATEKDGFCYLAELK